LRERISDQELATGRAAWLTAQLVAIEANAQGLVQAPLGFTGEAYLDHVTACFDWRPERRPAQLFAEARADVDQLLQGPGTTIERLAAWDEALTIPPERLRAVVDWLLPILRDRAGRLFGLPPGESLQVGLVSRQPWAGYNWYDGGLQSRVDVNTDLPVRAPDLVGLLAHEAYPGHHLEHAWKEAHLVQVERRVESSILLINTPECLISEGLADLGRRFALGPGTEPEILVELLERAGLASRRAGRSASDVAATAIALHAPRRRLAEFDVNAALRRHVDGADRLTVQAELEQVALFRPDRAAKTLDFIEHPLWRTYIFVYAEGEALLGRWLDAVPEVDRPARFRRLLTEQITPATIVAEIERTVAG
jgi:hypothetical protein